MKHRQLGNIEVSPIGMGCMGLSHGYGDIPSEEYARQKQATKAQVLLAWMLHKYNNVVPIPGSKNLERILENLGAWNVNLSDDEFTALDNALKQIPIQGYRGFEEFDGGTMTDWGKKK